MTRQNVNNWGVGQVLGLARIFQTYSVISQGEMQDLQSSVELEKEEKSSKWGQSSSASAV